MPKNIVLLSDGTGNSSAQLLKTNVWRVYESLDLDDPAIQVACYDDGVGTSSFKPLQILGGALGVGLKRNVLRLYRFLCEHYDPGDRIYAFGFSRGAFTIRVLVGLVCHQGIIKTRPTSPVASAYPNHDPAAALEAALAAPDFASPVVYGSELARLTKWAYRGYRREFNQTGKLVDVARALRDAWLRLFQRGPRYNPALNHPAPPIEFVGVWDTVDAYGLPVDELTDGINKWVWPLSAPDLELPSQVQKACHALAIDDERNTFHPVLWDESKEPPHAQRADHLDRERISQVWFAGMHSNVGGGYADDALSYVSFKWIVTEAAKRQLHFVKELVDAHKAKADPFGRIYDSRSGLKGYYRYNPRKIEWLINGQVHEQKAFGRWVTTGPTVAIARAKIHESVFARISAAPEAYAPIIFPEDYGIVREDGSIMDAATNPYELLPLRPQRVRAQERAWDLVWWRRLLYFANVIATVVLLAGPFLWAPPGQVTAADRNVISRLLAVLDRLIGWTPDSWIAYYSAHPTRFLVLVGTVVALMWISARLQSAICMRMRAVWSEVVPPPGRTPLQLKDPHGAIFRLRTNKYYLGTTAVFRHFVLPPLFGIGTLVLLALLGTAVANRLLFETANAAGVLCTRTAQPRPVGRAVEQGSLPTNSFCHATGLSLEERRRYRVSVAFNGARDGREMQVGGTEGFVAGDAPNGRLKTIFTVFGPFRRVLSANWFVPVARVGAGWFEQHLLADPENVFTARRDGELFLFVNDSIAPIGQSEGGTTFGWRASYPNNQGRLDFTIQCLDCP